jgi:uncharacterized protein
MDFQNIINARLFSAIFISIFLEALPFLLLGALLSSIIEIFVSGDFFRKIIPKNVFLGLLIASLTGLVFPVCECAIVPVIGRLHKKGMPLHICIALMLSIPIVNVSVILSTYFAFITDIRIFILRIVLGSLIPCIIGYIFYSFKKDKTELSTKAPDDDCKNYHGHDHEPASVHRDESIIPENAANALNKIKEAIIHTTEEFFDIGKFFLIGTFITSLFQTVIPRYVFNGIGNDLFLSMILMMFLAFFLSVCSNTDAFIARSFLGQFTQGSVLAFIVFGAMIDLKNTTMLLKYFDKKFVLFLIFSIFSVCFLTIGLIGMFLKG